MAVKTVLDWQDGMSFDVELQGHHFPVDASPEFGGKNRGPRPKPLLLSALGGCTAMDVVSLLGKMKVPYDRFTVEVEGESRSEHPQVFTKILIRYIFTGSQLDGEKIDKAIALSLEKYCGVHAMLAQAAEITHQVVLNPA